METANFSDKLQGGGPNLLTGDGRFEIKERSDVSAHFSELLV